MSSEVEYKGIKIRGGKLLLIFPLLGSIGAALWGGFEGYARWVAMEDKINSDEAHDLVDNYLDKYAVQVYKQN